MLEDTRFSLPSVHDPASTEVGVILLGLDADRLLAGLGMAAASELAGDPAVVALLVDEARHGLRPREWKSGPEPAFPLTSAALSGARRWRSLRAGLAAAGPATVSAAPRQAWAQTYRALAAAAPAGEPATHSYLTACWLRRVEVDRRATALVETAAATGVTAATAATAATE